MRPYQTPHVRRPRTRFETYGLKDCTESQGEYAAENLVNGYGLRVSGLAPAPETPAAGAPLPHAALLYQNDAPTGDMQGKVVMSPEKTAGQG